MRKTSPPHRTVLSPKPRQCDHTNNPDQLLTVPEVITRLHLSRAKVYDLIRSRQLKSGTVGRARRIPESAVSAYICQLIEMED